MKLTLLPLQNDDIIRILCEGPITRFLEPGADPLRDLLGPHFRSLKVLLNLERAQSIDTSGVSWLIRECRAFAEAGGRLVFYLAPPVIGQVLDFMRLGPLLPLVPDESAARDLALAGPEPQPATPYPNRRPTDQARIPG
jgi:anti-anti-sigma regulatory factor